MENINFPYMIPDFSQMAYLINRTRLTKTKQLFGIF